MRAAGSRYGIVQSGIVEKKVTALQGPYHGYGGRDSTEQIACFIVANLLCPASVPPAVIQHVVWLYRQLTLSYREVEGPLPECRLDVSYETVRRWG
ncbi:MAG TPA: hypothetical protein VFM24_05820 [Nitrospira sp.]|nr:hypothetical protein [Nitrospira sp.]